MEINILPGDSKQDIFTKVEKYLTQQHFDIVNKDDQRPWGGFFVIDEADAEAFINKYFSHLTKSDLTIGGKLSPKILLVAPQKRLSWQYHFRRAEIWKLIGGVAGVVTSPNDVEQSVKELEVGEIVQLHQGERHRLIGLNGWGIVAEIWQHTHVDHPSDEEDIVRLQDDFGR